jgi:hypothetical protein
MRLYNHAHRFYAGIDLHARSMFTHVLDAKGKTVFEHEGRRPDVAKLFGAARLDRDGHASLNHPGAA